MTPRYLSAVVWEGPSCLDWGPIALVLTGLGREGSGNIKTGATVQAYIVRRDMSPLDAIHLGADASVCGDCPLRGDGTGKGRRCYVQLHTGLGVVGRMLLSGSIPRMTLADVAQLLTGRVLRLGTYGDPAAVPWEVWASLVPFAASWLGYTHQWRKFPELRPLVMASAESPEDASEARAAGWRTFRVRGVDAAGQVEPLEQGEVTCPASAEGGKRTTCDKCGLCSGLASKAKSVAIVDHSTRARLRLKVVA